MITEVSWFLASACLFSSLSYGVACQLGFDSRTARPKEPCRDATSHIGSAWAKWWI